MVRSLGGLGILALAFALAGCAAAAGGGAASSPTPSHTATPTPVTANLDGDWIVQVADPQATCIGVGDRILHVSEGTGSIAPAIAGSASPILRGPVRRDGDTVSVHLERTSPTKDALDVEGTVGTDGVVRAHATAGGIHPGGTNGYTCTFDLTLIRALDASAVPPFDTVDGTWCQAADASTCLTIADGKVSFGSDPPEATLSTPRTEGFGLPCYVSAALPSQPGGGFALYFCPAGVAIEPGGGDVDGEIVSPHDNAAYDRLYTTQNPPFLQTWFRADERQAALNG